MQVPLHGVDLTESAAGVPSVRQSLAQEPSFPRKKRVVGSEGQISSEGVLRQDEGERTGRNEVSSSNPVVFRVNFRARNYNCSVMKHKMCHYPIGTCFFTCSREHKFSHNIICKSCCIWTNVSSSMRILLDIF